jgi:putative transposase
MPTGPHKLLPRLADAAYRDRQFVHWTMTIAGRLTGWLTPEFHAFFRETLRRNAERHGVIVPVYCLMPDHLHVLASGVRLGSDQILWSRAIRRSIKQALKPVSLQKQAYDHVLRPDESGLDAFVSLAFYISENPVRAGLSSSARDWPYAGSVVPALPELDPRDKGFRERWWAYWNALES